MNKIWVIARREFLATVRTRAFVISIVLLPVMMLLGAGVGVITRTLEDKQERSFVVIDRTPGGKVFPLLKAAAERRKQEKDPRSGEPVRPVFRLEEADPEADADEQRLALSARVRKGEITGFLEVGPEFLTKKGGKPDNPLNDPRAARYQSRPNLPGSMEFYNWAIFEMTLVTMLEKGFPGLDMRKLLTEGQKPPVLRLGLSSREPDGSVSDDAGATKALARIFVGIGCIMLMFVIVFVVSTPMMQGVLEEKMARISEVLLGSVTPFQLMAGKLLGGLGVAMVLASVYVGGAYGGLHYYGYGDQVPAWLIGWFAFYLVLALLTYGSLFMAVGAACTDMKEPQTLMMPVMLPAMIPLFLLAPILTSPDGLVARVASFFPPCTPMIMIARLALSANIAWWEPVLGSALVLAFTALCVWMAGRIFRVGILVQGKGATLGELVGWAIRG